MEEMEKGAWLGQKLSFQWSQLITTLEDQRSYKSWAVLGTGIKNTSLNMVAHIWNTCNSLN